MNIDGLKSHMDLVQLAIHSATPPYQVILGENGRSSAGYPGACISMISANFSLCFPAVMSAQASAAISIQAGLLRGNGGLGHGPL
jgi:hypothetical protein